MEDRQIILQVKNLRQHFPIDGGGLLKKTVGYIRAVDGISFDVYKGETVGIVGESGCGKSTTVRSIAQLYKPTTGEVLFHGVDLCKADKDTLLKERRNIQMIFQDPYASLDPRMTVRNIIMEPLKVYNSRGLLEKKYTDDELDERVKDLMEKVGINKAFVNRYPHEFSGGQRQRIGIARALALRPEIILADEPVSALDVSIQAQILNLISDIQKEMGVTFIFIAHDLGVIQHISHRVIVMYLGKIMEVAESDELYSRPLHPYTEALLSAAPIPDPKVERNRQRIVLEGDVPSPDKERHCCYFYDRCSKRMDKCAHCVPPMFDCGNGHKVACFLYDDKPVAEPADDQPTEGELKLKEKQEKRQGKAKA